MNKEKGITLISLVVTIIILMLLAGITLTLVLEKNGIIEKAKEAKKTSSNAEISTMEGLNNLENELELATSRSATKISDITTIKDAINKSAVATTDNVKLKDDEGNTVTIPAGFEIASDSATKQGDGIVIEDKDGNQFVWIPVANISDYNRTDFGKGATFSVCLETMPGDEQTSVNTYHGYYIGRYEAGDKESTANKAMRTSGASITNTVVIKKGQIPYNYVTDYGSTRQAQTLAENMKTVEGYKATTKLCSSYAWDTAIKFLQNKVPSYGGTNSPQGNYIDTTFSYKNITGVNQIKALNSGVLIPTGETTAVCNIYDMGGNEWEYTTENYGNDPYYVLRGGCGLIYSNTDCPAGCRFDGSTGTANSFGFRPTLFL